MPIITITGLHGSGAAEVGAEVARSLRLDYVDRVILAEAARKMGATVAEVAEQAERPMGVGDRVASFARSVLERSALAGSAADPYFGGGMDMLLVREYRDIPDAQPSGDGGDRHLLEVLTGVINEIAQADHAVIIGRGANMVLRDRPGTIHIGTIAEHDTRVRRIMERQHIDTLQEAERYVEENDKARTAFYQRFFGVHPQDARCYHMVLNTELMGEEKAADMVIAALESLGPPV